jgi:hypothetical protein
MKQCFEYVPHSCVWMPKPLTQCLTPPHFVSIVRVGKPKPKDKCVAFHFLGQVFQDCSFLQSLQFQNFKKLRRITIFTSPCASATFQCISGFPCNQKVCKELSLTTHEMVFRFCHTFMCLDAKNFDMHEKFAAIHIGRWFCLASCNILVFRCQNL